MLLRVDVSKESDMLLGVYANMLEKHLGEFWESGSGVPKVYILRFRSQLWMTQGTEVVGIIWMSGVKKMKNEGNSGAKEKDGGQDVVVALFELKCSEKKASYTECEPVQGF